MMIDKDDIETYICRVDGNIIGFATIILPAIEDGVDTGEIKLLYLRPDFWSRGFGSQLARHMLDVFRDRGYEKVKLWAFKDNVRADGFYRALGFERDDKSRLIEKFDNAEIVRYSRMI